MIGQISLNACVYVLHSASNSLQDSLCLNLLLAQEPLTSATC